MGVEPTCQAWEACILPMNYSRVNEWRKEKLAPFFGRSDGT